MKQLELRSKTWIVVGLTIVAVAVTLLLPPFGQDLSYHNFADKRTFLGIPNFLDVVSNALFALVGIWGLLVVHRSGSQQLLAESRRSYFVFFLGVALTSVGSAYYHLAPDNARLVWDRLPMTVSFMSLLSAMMAERVSPKVGKMLLVPLLTAGVVSVLYWYWSEVHGHGDLRFYSFLVQAYPLLLVLVMMSLFRPVYSHGGLVTFALLVYACAKIAEVYDHQIFAFNSLVSGHTIKHVLAAASICLLASMLRRRSSVQSINVVEI